MFNIKVEKLQDSIFNISPMSIKRDWMDQTSGGHAYRCFPVTQANVIGWSLSCTEDISFEWNGINDQTPDTVKLFSPAGAYSGRGQSSISLHTGLYFKTDQDVSLLTINPVNFFSNEFETMSSLVTTSFYDNPLPLALKAKVANKVVTIKAGTPIATIIPISLTNLNNSVIEINAYSDPGNKRRDANISYGQASQGVNSAGEWAVWYRNAVNEKNESLGKHEVKTLKLIVKNNIESDIM